MDNKTIFIRTDKGNDEVRSKPGQLFGDIKRVLPMVDGIATFGEISKRVAPSLRQSLNEVFLELEKGGFIHDAAKAGNIPKLVVPPKIVTPPIKKTGNGGLGELDFTTAPASGAMATEKAGQEADKLKAAAEAQARAEAEAEVKHKAEAASIRAEAEAKARQEIEAARLKAEQDAAKMHEEVELARQKAAAKAHVREEAERHAREEAEAARAKAEQEAAIIRAELEAEKARAQAREEAERRARETAETEKLKMEHEAELARQKAAAEASAREEAERRAREEAEAARARAEQETARLKAEAQAREEAEAARIKAEQEAAKAREEAERRAREEAEAARARAEQETARLKAEAQAREEAEAARIKAEQEVAKAREEAELTKQKAVAEAREREEAERRAREEAEAARVKAEQEAARIHAELEAARARAEAEAKAREEAECRAREAAEAARLMAEQEAEAARIRAGQEIAKMREEAELAMQVAAAEAREREEAEQRARAEAEAKAVEETERRTREAEEVARLTVEQETGAHEEAVQAVDAAVGVMLIQPTQDWVQDKVASEAARPVSPGEKTARFTSATVLFIDVVGYTRQSANKQIKIKKQFTRLLADCLKVQGADYILLDTGDGAAVGFLQHPEDALQVAAQFRDRLAANQHKDYPGLHVRIGIHLGPINVAEDMNGQRNMVGDGINDAQRVMSFAGSDQIYISRPYYDFVSRLNDEYADLFQYRGQKMDKHGREHHIYELVRADVHLAGGIQPQITGTAAEINLEPFSFTLPEVMPEPELHHREEIKAGKGDTALLDEIGRLTQPESKPADVEMPQKNATPAEPQTPEPAMAEKTEKPVAEARIPSEEEVKKAAEQHSKIWEQAEQRAMENARAIAERASQPQPEVVMPPVQAKQRKPIPWGKMGAALFVLMLILLFAVPFVLPTQGYATRIEQHLAAQLKQPVHIGHLAGRLLPTPRLELSDVSIGEKKQIQAQQARVDFAFSALFSSARPINFVVLEKVQVDGAALPQVSSWLQQAAADRQYPVAKILLDQGMLETNGIKFAGVGGELNFDQDGKFSQAKLHAEQGKYALDINAAPENKLLLSAMVRGNASPFLPDWVFDELNVKGELTGDSLKITSLDGHIHGGKLSGEALIDWRSDWRAQGMLTANAVDLKNVSQVLGGNMDATVNFLMQSPVLDKLAASAVMNGSFVIDKGTINGVDIVETVRLRSRENLPGGRTHFDQLSGNLSFANGEYHFRQLKIDAGVLKATGAVDVVGRSVSGQVSANLTMRADMGTVTLQVGGASDSPTLRAVR